MHETELPLDQSGPLDDTPKSSTSCFYCRASFSTVQEQRRHAKSDWHGYNLKLKLRGAKLVTEVEFEKLIDDLNESISGSESSGSEEREEQKEKTLTLLLKKQANVSQTDDNATEFIPKHQKRGSGKPPLIWFSSPSLPHNTSLGVYRALFTDEELAEGLNLVEVICQKQLSPILPREKLSKGSDGVPLSQKSKIPQIFLCMIGGGHFAGMVVSLAPKIGKKSSGVEERQAVVLAHKTFHRYTTRRKQGGAQSANDSAKGAAHSAGASIRRYNEAALETEIRSLLTEWKDLIQNSELIFVRATGTANKRILFGPYDGQVLRPNDPRNRGFPFTTRRATQAELMRAFIELTRMKVTQIDEEAVAAAAATAQSAREALAAKSMNAPIKSVSPRISKDDEEAFLHTSQLHALIRRSKAPAVLAYLSNNSISPDFLFYPSDSQANHHAPRPLHLAASINSAAVAQALILKAGADPTIVNAEGYPPFDLAGDRATRDAFRVARAELGEDRWDWQSAHCPPPLSKAEAEKRAERLRADAENEETERRKAETERLKRESLEDQKQKPGKKGIGKTLGTAEKTPEERREEEARGLTPEMRMKVERERRARAAEARMRGITGGGSGDRGAGR